MTKIICSYKNKDDNIHKRAGQQISIQTNIKRFRVTVKHIIWNSEQINQYQNYLNTGCLKWTYLHDNFYL